MVATNCTQNRFFPKNPINFIKVANEDYSLVNATQNKTANKNLYTHKIKTVDVNYKNEV